MDICIAVFAYNEQDNVEQVVREVRAELDRIEGDHEVVIIDDGSTDRTSEISRELARAVDGVRVVEHAQNQGLGGAYRSGFEHATKELLTFWPADGQFDPAIITRFWKLIADQDLVLGYLPNRKRTLVGRFLSAGERALYRTLFGRLPRFQGILMLRRDLLDEIELVSTGRGWAVIMELVIRVSRGGWRVSSVPTDLRPRMDGRSKVTDIRTIASNLRQIIDLRARM